MRPRPRPIVVRPTGHLSSELVHGLRERASRDAQGLFLAEGACFLRRALEHGAAFAGLVICPPRLHGALAREAVTETERAGVPLLRVSPAEYRDLSPGASEVGENAASVQGILLVLRQRWHPLPDALDRDLWIGVESVRTPGNLGTLLRAGEAAGASGLVVFDRAVEGTPQGVDPYDPAVVRATMGSHFAHRFVRTTHRAFRRWPRRHGLQAYGGSPEAEADYRERNYRGPTLLMLGDERTGLSDGQRGSCDGLVRIPMVGAPDSLNLAMAGTLMLYEALNQRCPARHSMG